MEKRKPYVKPVIASVNLIPDEAVLGNCKSAAGGGVGTSSSCALAGCQNLPDGS